MVCKIIHDRENCIGCGACAAVDPENWRMNEDGKSDLINSKKTDDSIKKEIDKEDLDKSLETAQSCPVNVIHIKDGDKELV